MPLLSESYGRDIFRASSAIHKKLDEPKKTLGFVCKIVQEIGIQEAQAILEVAQAIQADGGLLRKDGKPRTIGGVWFFLVREQYPDIEAFKERGAWFLTLLEKRKAEKQARKQAVVEALSSV